MTPQIDLVWLSDTPRSPPEWPLGKAWQIPPAPPSVARHVEAELPRSTADAWLFWDCRLGQPNQDVLLRTLDLPGHVWHAGLRLKTGGLPQMIDFVLPTWPLNCDPPPHQIATSWRVSLSACLILTDVLRQMGGARAEFESLDAAALELGYRYLSHGVFVRHVPELAPENPAVPVPNLSFADELRFLSACFNPVQHRWALFRMLASGYASPRALLNGWRKRRSDRRLPPLSPYRPNSEPPEAAGVDGGVTVLIPTVNRYSYLRTVLAQLRTQTVSPRQIIVVDQTSPEERDHTLADAFPDLPLELIYLDQPGQCSARNAGLRAAQGRYVLFIDDDDEVTPTLISQHLHALSQLRAEVSSGVAEEVGAGPIPANFTFQRINDGFPTNNSMIRKDVLRGSGLFDLAYDRGQRADGDLGMRIYLSGALMILRPEISVLHHHAPSGGLRTHKARVVTRASSRQSLTQRHLPSASEIYLARRYFTPRQVREALWLRAFGTFSGRGSRSRRLGKAVVALLLLPDTCLQIARRYRTASDMLTRFPQIPAFTEDGE